MDDRESVRKKKPAPALIPRHADSPQAPIYSRLDRLKPFEKVTAKNAQTSFVSLLENNRDDEGVSRLSASPSAIVVVVRAFSNNEDVALFWLRLPSTTTSHIAHTHITHTHTHILLSLFAHCNREATTQFQEVYRFS